MEVHICEQIKDDGIRCGSPARRGASFCHFHLRMNEDPIGRRGPYKVAAMDSTASVQITITHTLQALLDDSIDIKKANALFRGLSLALQTLRPSQRGKLSSSNLSTMLQQVRSYYDTPEAKSATPEQKADSTPSPATIETVSSSANTGVTRKIDVPIPPNPYKKKSPASAKQLSPTEIAAAKKIIRLGPKHPRFHECAKLLDTHIAITKV